MRMKYLWLIILSANLSAQISANRFFYELQYKPQKDSTLTEQAVTILDILSHKSIYQDYTTKIQDSIIFSRIKSSDRLGALDNISVPVPKFTYKVTKKYPTMEITFSDRLSKDIIGYTVNESFNWELQSETSKIGKYDAQKATVSFGGRKWIAWFTYEIPFPDGPYKFYGLPGLIVKIEDLDKNYSWKLIGNEIVQNFNEFSNIENMISNIGGSNTVKITSKEKFNEAYNFYKADPLAEFKMHISPEVMRYKMPGSDKSIGDELRAQEESYKRYFNSNNNPIELD